MSIELTRIDHIGVAVTDMEQAIALYGGKLGMGAAHRELLEDEGVEAALLDVGDGHIELLLPTEEDTPVGRFIARRAPWLILLVQGQPKRKRKRKRKRRRHPPQVSGSCRSRALNPACSK